MPPTARLAAAVAIVSLISAACQPAAAPTPTTALTVAPAAPTTPAAQTTGVNGTLNAINGNTLTVDTTTGPKDVAVASSTVFQKEGPLAVSDLKPGLNVGITGQPDGTAVSIRIFQPGLNIRAGQFPMTGADQGHVMTNTTIKSFDGQTLVADMGGDNVTITVPPTTQVVGPTPATAADLSAGKRVSVTATPTGPNGSLVASSVYITGTPPAAAG